MERLVLMWPSRSWRRPALHVSEVRTVEERDRPHDVPLIACPRPLLDVIHAPDRLYLVLENTAASTYIGTRTDVI